MKKILSILILSIIAITLSNKNKVTYADAIPIVVPGTDGGTDGTGGTGGTDGGSCSGCGCV